MCQSALRGYGGGMRFESVTSAANHTAKGPFAVSNEPLAGFGIIEAADINEVIRLVLNTPCARAKGAVEIRAIAAIND
jgi:hypothetical protein